MDSQWHESFNSLQAPWSGFSFVLPSPVPGIAGAWFKANIHQQPLLRGALGMAVLPGDEVDQPQVCEQRSHRSLPIKTSQKPHQLSLCNNRNGTQVLSFPSPSSVSSQPCSGRGKENVEKVQKLLYLLWVWREAERHSVFTWIFSGHSHNCMQLMRLSPVAVTESKSGSGLPQGGMCLLWGGWDHSVCLPRRRRDTCPQLDRKHCSHRQNIFCPFSCTGRHKQQLALSLDRNQHGWGLWKSNIRQSNCVSKEKPAPSQFSLPFLPALLGFPPTWLISRLKHTA